MKIFLNIILIIILLIIFLYNFKNIREGLEIITAKSQPPIDSALYDYNLRQATAIWNKIGCTDGSYKPAANNKTVWAKEDYEEELKAYKLEADKLHKEHNYYIYIGENSDKSKKTINGRNAVGISEAWKRCYDVESDLSNYIYPKIGDRVKIKKDENSDISKYYTGIVIKHDREKKAEEVLWDSQGNEGTTNKDTKRTKTKDLGVQVNRNKNIKNDIAEFGWPYHEWNRHPDSKKKQDKFVAENGKGWANWTGIFMKNGKVDPKQIYRMTECKEITECDNLHCGKRKTEILNRYPITYYCESDPRNDKPIGKGFYCKGGKADGAITQYFKENTMCFKQEKGAKFGRKFCKDMCGGGSCQIYDNEHNIRKKFHSKNHCYALAFDEKGRRGNRAYIKQDKQYSNTDLKKMGLKKGEIQSISKHGKHCDAVTRGTNIYNKYPTRSIKLKKNPAGCKIELFDHKNSVQTYLFKKGSAAGKKNGIDYAINNYDMKKFSLKGVGGLATNKCSVELYSDSVIKNINCGGKNSCINKPLSKVISKIKLFEYTPPFHVLKKGYYKIISKRNNKECKYDPTGAAKRQRDRMHCGTGDGENRWYLTPLDPSGKDKYGYSLKPYSFEDCFQWNKGTDWYIQCDWQKKKSNNQEAYKFDIVPISDGWKETNIKNLSENPNSNKFVNPGWCTIKSRNSKKYCANVKDIFAPGKATMACDRNSKDTWEQFEFIAI